MRIKAVVQIEVACHLTPEESFEAVKTTIESAELCLGVKEINVENMEVV